VAQDGWQLPAMASLHCQLLPSHAWPGIHTRCPPTLSSPRRQLGIAGATKTSIDHIVPRTQLAGKRGRGNPTGAVVLEGEALFEAGWHWL
jgi:hypothetical protein